MFKLSKASKAKLDTCHPKIQTLINEAIKYVDITVLEGHRNKEAQNREYEAGRSKLKWPHGKHNTIPSQAVDIAPYPIDWKDEKRFIRVLSFIQGLACGMGIKVRLGGDWNSDFVFNESFYDWPHIELVLEQ